MDQQKLLKIIKKELNDSRNNKYMKHLDLIKIISEKYKNIETSLLSIDNIKKLRVKIRKEKFRKTHKKDINLYKKVYFKTHPQKLLLEIEFFSNKWYELRPQKMTSKIFATHLLELYKANLDSTINFNLSLVSNKVLEKRVRIRDLKNWYELKPKDITHLQFADFLLELFLQKNQIICK